MKAAFAAFTMLLLIPSAVPASAVEPIANAGRLTCTLDPVPPGAAAEAAVTRDLSCVFEPITGVKTSYTGTVERFGDNGLVDENIVLAWTVLAPDSDIAPGSLSGRYVSSLSDAQPPSAMKIGSLRRDGVVPIELRALTVDATAGDEPTIVMELNLVAARA